ncbi:MAG: hypothetical protein JW982_06060 [Spirochaetes bacterium]|nr:hypothetical protein [Spirochaetota bacterium]
MISSIFRNSCILMLLCIMPLAASNYPTYLPDDSIGFIYETDKIDSLGEHIHFPRNKKIILTENNSEENEIYMFSSECEDAIQNCWDNSVYADNRKTHILNDDFVSVDYDGYCLKYYANRGKYLRILDKTKSCWVSINELKANGLSYKDWKSFIFDIANQKVFYPLNNLKVMESADSTGKILTEISGKNFQIKLTGKSSQSWAEAIVSECDYSKSDYYEPFVIRKIQGWIKIVDDNRNVTIWFSPKG